MKKFNITVDGFGVTGKSSLAVGVAKALGFKALNTGDIYRAFAVAFSDLNYGTVCTPNIKKMLANTKIEVKFFGDEQHTFVGGVDVTARLHTEEISMLVPKISPYLAVRERTEVIQRKFAADYDCVVEGRTVGVDVLPNADLKIFVTARPEVRAQRRFLQIKDKENVTFEQVLRDLNARDRKDRTRKNAPTRPASDAVIIDTSDLTLEEGIEKVVALARQKLGKRKS